MLNVMYVTNAAIFCITIFCITQLRRTRTVERFRKPEVRDTKSFLCLGLTTIALTTSRIYPLVRKISSMLDDSDSSLDSLSQPKGKSE